MGSASLVIKLMNSWLRSKQMDGEAVVSRMVPAGVSCLHLPWIRAASDFQRKHIVIQAVKRCAVVERMVSISMGMVNPITFSSDGRIETVSGNMWNIWSDALFRALF